MGTSVTGLPRDRRCEIIGVVMLGLAGFLFLALATDGYQGSSSRPMPDVVEQAHNALGPPGAWLAGVLTILLGRAAHVLYLLLVVWGFMMIRHHILDRLLTRLVGMVILCGGIAGMLHIDFASSQGETLPGGAIGAYTGDMMLRWFGYMPSNVVGVTLAVIGILLATEFLIIRMVAQGHSLGVLMLGGTVILTRMLMQGME